MSGVASNSNKLRKVGVTRKLIKLSESKLIGRNETIDHNKTNERNEVNEQNEISEQNKTS